MGKDGALEFVDNAKKRTRDQMDAWKLFRPHERAMVDRFIGSPCHVIVTMRTKTDYEEQIKPDGMKKRVKVGLAPVQRDGLEYEFDLVCSMDDENNLVIDKTRCSAYSQEKMRVVSKPGARYFRPFIEWLDGPVIDRIESAPAGVAVPHLPVPPSPGPEGKPWRTAGEMRRLFQAIREQIGETAYLTALANANVHSVADFLAIRPVSKGAETALQCYNRMLQIAKEEAA